VQGERSPRGRSSSPGVRSPSPLAPPSGYARDVVRGLGVQGSKASAAAAIVDKVMKLTAAQLLAMDSDTREQVMRVRRDLGLGDPPAARSRRASPATAPPTGDKRSRSHRRQSREYDEEDDFSQI